MAGGRPTRYKPENAEIARHACMLGATNASLAERFEVCRRTIDNWIATIPEFSDAVQQAREPAGNRRWHARGPDASLRLMFLSP